jgi:ADP-heptose:LPS heptosyltransferase
MRQIPRNRRTLKRIVVLARMTYGDFVLMLPFLSELRHRNPDAKVTMICGPRGSGLCRLFPGVDDVINLADLRPGYGCVRTVRRVLGLVRSDVIYALHPLFSAAVAAFVLFGRRRIGFSQAAARLFDGSDFVEMTSVGRFQSFLLRRILLTESMPMHVGDRHASMRFVQLLGEETEKVSLRGQLAARYPRVRPVRPCVILAPFSGWSPKDWPLDRWVELARRIRRDVPAAKVVVSVDQQTAAAAHSAFAEVRGSETFVPGDDLDRLFRTFATASLVVSNDSFPLHVATVLDVPSVGLFGPNLPAWFGGMSESHEALFQKIDCNPCAQRRAQKLCARGLRTCAGLEWLSVEAVAARCSRLLAPSRICSPVADSAASRR